MKDKIKRPSRIQDELSQAGKLIRENMDLIDQYPDRFSLKLHLMSLQNRENELLLELRESYKRRQMETFDIDINGKNVERYRISSEVLGNLLIKYQRVITSIAAQSDSEEPLMKPGPISQTTINNSRLDVAATCPAASIRIVFSSNKPELTESKAITALKRFNKLLNCEDHNELIKQEIKDLGPRTIIRYKDLLNTIYKTKSNIKFYDLIKPDGFETKVVTHDLAKRIVDMIIREEIIPPKEDSFSGILKGLTLINYKFQFVIDSGEIIAGEFDPSLSEDVKNNLDKPSIARFKIRIKQNEMTEELDKDYFLLGFEE